MNEKKIISMTHLCSSTASNNTKKIFIFYIIQLNVSKIQIKLIELFLPPFEEAITLKTNKTIAKYKIVDFMMS